ncbi:MAG: RNA 2',3'-cyclic phosphodiesterase [Planctomycetes bacterium]|nr:RNA 2',3'-cyclic phosphodiesterase [Planctomycetota bacterium]
MNARLFFALQPPPELARRLHARGAELLAPCAQDLRFYAAEELHLTLVFLGASPVPRLPRLELEPLELELTGGGAFPDPVHPRAVWAGAREVPGAGGRLAELAARLRAGLGLPAEEQPFRPHLTLARPRPGTQPRLPAGFAALELPGTWLAREVRLFESRPDERPRYRVLAQLALEG